MKMLKNIFFDKIHDPVSFLIITFGAGSSKTVKIMQNTVLIHKGNVLVPKNPPMPDFPPLYKANCLCWKRWQLLTLITQLKLIPLPKSHTCKHHALLDFCYLEEKEKKKRKKRRKREKSTFALSLGKLIKLFLQAFYLEKSFPPINVVFTSHCNIPGNTQPMSDHAMEARYIQMVLYSNVTDAVKTQNIQDQIHKLFIMSYLRSVFS